MKDNTNNLVPEECCDFGEFKCQVPIPISGKVQFVDICIAHIVSALNAANITTVASCCGHGKINASIILEDDKELVLRKFDESNYNSNRVME